MTELEIRQGRAVEYSRRVRSRRLFRFTVSVFVVELALVALAVFLAVRLYW